MWPIIEKLTSIWGRALGNRQGGATHVNQVDGVSDMVLQLYGCVWGRAQKGDNAGVLSGRKLCSSTCPDASGVMVMCFLVKK